MKRKLKIVIFLVLSIICAFCAASMIMRHEYTLAVMDSFACALDIYIAWSHYNSNE